MRQSLAIAALMALLCPPGLSGAWLAQDAVGKTATQKMAMPAQLTPAGEQSSEAREPDTEPTIRSCDNPELRIGVIPSQVALGEAGRPAALTEHRAELSSNESGLPPRRTLQAQSIRLQV